MWYGIVLSSSYFTDSVVTMTGVYHILITATKCRRNIGKRLYTAIKQFTIFTVDFLLFAIYRIKVAVKSI